MERNQFTFYRSYFKAICRLPKGKRERILVAIISYALDGTPPKGLNHQELMAFDLVQPNLDSARKKARAGKAGAAVTNRMGSDKGEKENEIEIEKENEIEIENEIEGEGEIEDEEEGDGPFAAFWAAYPRKTEKKRAFAVWQRIQPDPVLVLRGLEKWKRSRQWLEDDGEFIPGAAKWLRGEYWMYPPEDTATPCGAMGELGQAELEAIRRVLGE